MGETKALTDKSPAGGGEAADQDKKPRKGQPDNTQGKTIYLEDQNVIHRYPNQTRRHCRPNRRWPQRNLRGNAVGTEVE